MGDGVRWWSFHNPEWGSFGLWHLNSLELVDVIALADQVGNVRQAAVDMYRLWDPS
jgi:hypothetical protein